MVKVFTGTFQKKNNDTRSMTFVRLAKKRIMIQEV